MLRSTVQEVSGKIDDVSSATLLLAPLINILLVVDASSPHVIKAPETEAEATKKRYLILGDDLLTCLQTHYPLTPLASHPTTDTESDL